MQNQNQDEINQTERIIAKAWADEAFKAQLLSDPTATLQAEGIELPPGVKLVAHENTAQTFHFVLPAKPDASSELSDTELEAVAGGEEVRKRFNYLTAEQHTSPVLEALLRLHQRA